MTGEATRSAAESAGIATKATRPTPAETASTETAHVNTAAVKAASTTTVKATATAADMPTAATTPAAMSTAAVLSEGRGPHRENSGEPRSPQCGLITQKPGKHTYQIHDASPTPARFRGLDRP